MWISKKRILLWHTARNILAIFYILHRDLITCCRTSTSFVDVQSKALSSDLVITGIISDFAKDNSSASVQVYSVLRRPKEIKINRKDIIQVEGLLPSGSSNHLPASQPAQLLDSLSSALIRSNSAGQRCVSYVTKGRNYILFINITRTADREKEYVYRTAHKSEDYTRADKKLIKKVVCDGCASRPNAKSKRNLEIKEGAYNYKIICRVEGSPLPDVKWYKGSTELSSSMKGIAVKIRRRRGRTKATIRIKNVLPEHAGLYKCVATNLLGQDTSKTQLKVKPRPTPPPPSSDVDWSSIDVDDIDDNNEPAVSHYIPCTGRDRDYCLHGGECRVFPDGRYKHCRCMARFKGARCEEANVIQKIPPIQPSALPTTGQSVELVNITTALVAILVVLVILLLVLAFYCAGWRYSRSRGKSLKRDFQYTSAHTRLLDEFDGKKTQQISPEIASVKLCQTVATQTDPQETSLQQLRRSLNLEDHFPRTTSDVVLRRKSSGSSRNRPSSNPLERRPTRSRLSATSTLTENKRLHDSDISTVPEQNTPTEHSVELDKQNGIDQSGGQILPQQANCDNINHDTASLHISESSLFNDSETEENQQITSTDEQSAYNKPLTNISKYAGIDKRYHLHNGCC